MTAHLCVCWAVSCLAPQPRAVGYLPSPRCDTSLQHICWGCTPLIPLSPLSHSSPIPSSSFETLATVVLQQHLQLQTSGQGFPVSPFMLLRGWGNALGSEESPLPLQHLWAQLAQEGRAGPDQGGQIPSFQKGTGR